MTPLSPSAGRRVGEVVSDAVTNIEIGILRSLFGRGDTLGIDSTTASTKALLPFCDLRWWVSQANTGLSANSSSGVASIHGSSSQTASLKRVAPPAVSKNISNLFSHIEQLSANWTVAAHELSDRQQVLINSPRSAVTLIRHKVDLADVVRQVIAAHAGGAAPAAGAGSETASRIYSNAEHVRDARERRHRMSVQNDAAAALRQLQQNYADICRATSSAEIERLRDSEYVIREVVVTPPATRLVDRSAVGLQRRRELDVSSHSLHEQAAARTEERSLAAARRRDAVQRSMAKNAAERDRERVARQHAQLRAGILSDMEKREHAALSVNRTLRMVIRREKS